MTGLPFLWGAQYYRAPTPEAACWEPDLRRMRELGFTDIKLWVQWRWGHRDVGRFYFDDLDRLMDLAWQHELRVTLNTIFDVAPLWLYERFPDAKQVRADGHVIEPYPVGHRQIGGNPGPCYNHPGALAARQLFMEVATQRFSAHPALAMWDVWNEPEQSLPSRTPRPGNYVCYCHWCQTRFTAWLQQRYQGSLDALNLRWGRCYEEWNQVEVPRESGVIADFIDFREFQLDTMTGEARWRLDTVARHDPRRTRYLHVVPNTYYFNPVSCVDDFALAQPCQVFAATMNGTPQFVHQTLSAGRGKVCYNVESHVNFGSVAMHPRVVSLDDLRRDFIPQLGLGVKGFLFWQYRPEVLGPESPAWGLVKPDGSDRPVTRAAKAFIDALAPYRDALLRSLRPAPTVGIWKSRTNDLFHWCAHESFDQLAQSVDGWLETLYWDGWGVRFIDGTELAGGVLDGLQVLVMPSCYYLTKAEAAGLDRWVRAGGTVICEAHLGGYDGDAGRHSRVTPGLGLAAAWGIREVDTTAAQHLQGTAAEAGVVAALGEDVQKALRDFGVAGGPFFPITLSDGSLTWGAERFAELAVDGGEILGRFGDVPCIVAKRIGAGRVVYAGTRWGQATRRDPHTLLASARRILAEAGARRVVEAQADAPLGVRVDALVEDGRTRFLAVNNRTGDPRRLTLAGGGRFRGLFSGVALDLASGAWTAPARSAELFIAEG